MDRYQAKIDDFILECQTIEDGFGKAIARYEYPYRDGAALEDMGQTARVIRLRCYWLEDNYQAHFDFLAHLKSRELFELSHPKYGLLTGCVESVMVRHDDRQETAEVDISFIEDLASQESAPAYQDVRSASEQSFQEGQQELMDAFAVQARAAVGSEAGAILAKEMDPELGILEQFSKLGAQTRAWIKSVEVFVTQLQAEAAAVANPANSLLTAIDYGAQLPGRVIGPLADTVERYARLHDSIRSAPERYLRNLQESIDDLAGRAAFDGLVRAAGAQRLSLEAAAIYADDEALRDRQRRREQAGGAFDILGNYLAPETATVMTVRELESSLAFVRAALQAVLDVDRTLQSIKAMACQLLQHVSEVKLERDRLVRIQLDNPMPLHLVCLMRGLPYAYAERILAVNHIAQPNFTGGQIDVYVR